MTEHTFAERAMLDAVAILQAGGQYARVDYDFPGIVVVLTHDGQIFVTGDANLTYTVDHYRTVRAFEDGEPTDHYDLRLDTATTEGKHLAEQLALVSALTGWTK